MITGCRCSALRSARDALSGALESHVLWLHREGEWLAYLGSDSPHKLGA